MNQLFGRSALDILEAIQIGEFRLLCEHPVSVSDVEKYILRHLFGEESAFSRERVVGALHGGLCVKGRKSYQEHRLYGHPPDHTSYPWSLGYALRHGAISKVQAGYIKFDHGETTQLYIERSAGLLDSVVKAFFDD